MRGWPSQATVAFIALVSIVPAALADNAKAPRSTKLHRMVIQVDQNDPTVMNFALKNATNVIEYYRANGDDVNVDVVAYGPGLHRLRADTSPVQDRIKNWKDFAFPSKIQFSACNVTKVGMEKKEGHPINVLSEVNIVPSGVVRLMELSGERLEPCPAVTRLTGHNEQFDFDRIASASTKSGRCCRTDRQVFFVRDHHRIIGHANICFQRRRYA
jgi:intracellular sulfur oxidation DsrE/DsrF family protein